MQLVNQCSFKKLTVSLLAIIFPFHVYLDSHWYCASKKPNKTPKKPPWLGFKKTGFSEP